MAGEREREQGYRSSWLAVPEPLADMKLFLLNPVTPWSGNSCLQLPPLPICYRLMILTVEHKALCRNVVPLGGGLKFFQVITTRLPRFWKHYWQRVIFLTSGLSVLDGSLIGSPVLKDLHGVFGKEAGTVFSDGTLVHLPT